MALEQHPQGDWELRRQSKNAEAQMLGNEQKGMDFESLAAKVPDTAVALFLKDERLKQKIIDAGYPEDKEICDAIGDVRHGAGLGAEEVRAVSDVLAGRRPFGQTH